MIRCPAAVRLRNDMRQPVKWDPELNVGAGVVDNQHKIIFDLINDLVRASEAMADRKVIDTLLDVIENYIFRHFEAEEDLVRTHISYQQHCLEHYGLIKEFRKIRLSFRNRNNVENSGFTFLLNWFISHIKEHDIPLFTSIASGGEARGQTRAIDEYPFETIERRRHKRIQRKKITDTDILADCYNASTLQYTQALLLDVSLGGIRIESFEPLTIGDLLVVGCPIGTHFKFNEKVRIVNQVEDTYGAEFLNLSPATEKFLIELYGAVSISTY